MHALLGIVLFFTTQIQALEIVLYYSPSCPYSRKVLRYLDSIDKTVPMKDISHNKEAKKELLEIGEEKIIPCLVIDGAPLYDANAIIEWLSTHQENLLPKKAA